MDSSAAVSAQWPALVTEPPAEALRSWATIEQWGGSLTGATRKPLPSRVAASDVVGRGPRTVLDVENVDVEGVVVSGGRTRASRASL